MSITLRRSPWVLHPLNAVLVAGSLALFLGALLSDTAYLRTFHIQWNNFSSWLLAGALFVGVFALIAAAVELFRNRRHVLPAAIYAVLVLATWILGFIDALVHAKDAWAAMPAGLALSAVVAALACAALGAALAGLGTGAAS